MQAYLYILVLLPLFLRLFKSKLALFLLLILALPFYEGLNAYMFLSGFLGYPNAFLLLLSLIYTYDYYKKDFFFLFNTSLFFIFLLNLLILLSFLAFLPFDFYYMNIFYQKLLIAAIILIAYFIQPLLGYLYLFSFVIYLLNPSLNALDFISSLKVLLLVSFILIKRAFKKLLAK